MKAVVATFNLLCDYEPSDAIRMQLFEALEQENVHELDAKKLKERSVVNIDIANDHVDANDYKKDEDPTIFKSEKTGRGPLSGDWKVGTVAV